MAPNQPFEFPSYTQTVHRQVYPSIDPSNPANSAKGRVVIVTGGGSGIGKDTAKAFVTAGAKAVVILGRREKILLEAKKELEAAGSSRVLTFVADVTDEKALENAFASTKKEFGAIDVTVGNAGYLAATGPPSQEDLDLDDYFKAFEINVKGTLLTWRAFFRHRGTAKSPVFVSISTAAAHGGIFPGFSSYAASKMSQVVLTSYLNAENPEIRSVSIHPGVIETDMYTKSELPLTTDDKSLPSSFVTWLASPAADWTGGLFLWAHWDVDELNKAKDQIKAEGHLQMNLKGWPLVEKPTQL